MAAQRIFISYRRQVSSAVVDRIFDVLAAVFGPENVFRDIASIDPGVRFDRAVDQSIRDCNAVLAVIGPAWETVERSGRPRLAQPDDHVRLEIEAALRSHAAVVPVLVDGASMPPAEALPESIRDLTRINAFTLDPDAFHDGLRRLCGHLFGYDPAAFAQRLDPSPWDDLVIPAETRKRLELVLSDVLQRDKVRAEWGVGRGDPVRPITIAFCGPSGCGKTLAARVLAGYLARDLYQVDLEEARLRSKSGDRLPVDWLFKHAVTGPALIQLRDAAGEMYAVAVSLLRRLQDRESCTILTTRGALDQRSGPWRFDHVVTFPFPDEAARHAIWRRAFPPHMPTALDIDFAALARHPLSGDSIRRAVHNAAVTARRGAHPVSMQDCLAAILLEPAVRTDRPVRFKMTE